MKLATLYIALFTSTIESFMASSQQIKSRSSTCPRSSSQYALSDSQSCSSGSLPFRHAVYNLGRAAERHKWPFHYQSRVRPSLPRDAFIHAQHTCAAFIRVGGVYIFISGHQCLKPCCATS